jgi:hypothetical protein
MCDPAREVGAELGVARSLLASASQELVRFGEFFRGMGGDHQQLTEAVDLAPPLPDRAFLPEEHPGQDQINLA